MPVHESLTTAERVATGSYNTSIHTHKHTHEKNAAMYRTLTFGCFTCRFFPSYNSYKMTFSMLTFFLAVLKL